jgi:hypothetical protein
VLGLIIMNIKAIILLWCFSIYSICFSNTDSTFSSAPQFNNTENKSNLEQNNSNNLNNQTGNNIQDNKQDTIKNKKQNKIDMQVVGLGIIIGIGAILIFGAIYFLIYPIGFSSPNIN